MPVSSLILLPFYLPQGGTMRRLTELFIITLGLLAIYGAHSALHRDATARAQTNQARVVLFEKFSRKS